MTIPTPIDKELAALGRAIRRERERKGMTPAQLARAAGVGRRRLAALEAGRNRAVFDLLVAVANGLGVRLGTLVSSAEDMERPAAAGREA
jgi:transcriptional regulator with XRE-family HTH domain